MGKLDGKVALVTGAGRGIGAAIARKLAGDGAKVVVSELDPAPAAEMVAAITAQGGVAVPLVGDVAAPDFGERAVATALDAFGDLDIIVNNAGYIWNSAIQNMSDAQWYAMIDVHATAPFRILRAAQPHFRAAAKREEEAGAPRHRKVVNVSSVSGLYGAATQFAYSAAKASLIGATRTLAKEWGRLRVNVNCVAFGFIDTRLTQRFEGPPATIDIKGEPYKVGLDTRTIEALTPTIPLGRPGTPEEAAGSVYLFCIPESDYVSGQVLVCDGGPRV
ncbi:MAG: SDR family NAD(P)-dependent oxidoreductase [Stellaceae bacterium]